MVLRQQDVADSTRNEVCMSLPLEQQLPKQIWPKSSVCSSVVFQMGMLVAVAIAFDVIA